MKTSLSTTLVIIATLMAVGGYLERVPTGADLLTPHYIGGFLKVVAGTLLAGLSGSPIQALIDKLSAGNSSTSNNTSKNDGTE